MPKKTPPKKQAKRSARGSGNLGRCKQLLRDARVIIASYTIMTPSLIHRKELRMAVSKFLEATKGI